MLAWDGEKPFNRTILELKLTDKRVHGTIIAAFNRTILELKYALSEARILEVILLIAPYWN